MTNNPNAKNEKQFFCEHCEFKCYKKSNYENHINTIKHQNLINPNANLTKKSKLFECNCGKIYKHSSTLCAHKKKCNGIKPPTISNDISSNCVITPELIIELIKDNKEMKQLMIEFCKNGVNNNNINSNNKS